MRQECRERFPRHNGLAIPTCITARAWRTSRYACRDRWLEISFEVGGGGNVPGIPGACATRNFTYLVRGPWLVASHINIMAAISKSIILCTTPPKTIDVKVPYRCQVRHYFRKVVGFVLVVFDCCLLVTCVHDPFYDTRTKSYFWKASSYITCVIWEIFMSFLFIRYSRFGFAFFPDSHI